LPFSLKQCAFYNQNLTPAPTGFSLVGITADSVLVHMGDAVEEQVNLVDRAQPLNSRISHSSRPTLWQDIFGKSALLLDAGHVEPPRGPVRDRNPRRMDWGILTEGRPSHHIPAAGVLFEPLIESLFGISEGHNTGQNRGQVKGPMEDIEMEDEKEQPPREITRDVTGGEMDMLVELFKSTEFITSSHRLPASPATLKYKIFTNGPQKPPSGKPNGIHTELTSSQSAPPSPVITPTKRHSKPSSNSAIPSPVISTAEKATSPEPPIKIGKKRRKPPVE